jgi:hypothetical protein
MKEFRIKYAQDALMLLGMPIRTAKGNPTQPSIKTVDAKAKAAGVNIVARRTRPDGTVEEFVMAGPDAGARTMKPPTKPGTRH